MCTLSGPKSTNHQFPTLTQQPYIKDINLVSRYQPIGSLARIITHRIDISSSLTDPNQLTEKLALSGTIISMRQ